MARDELIDLINEFIADRIPEQDPRVPVLFSPSIRSTTAVEVLDNLIGWSIRNGRVT